MCWPQLDIAPGCKVASISGASFVEISTVYLANLQGWRLPRSSRLLGIPFPFWICRASLHSRLCVATPGRSPHVPSLRSIPCRLQRPGGGAEPVLLCMLSSSCDLCEGYRKGSGYVFERFKLHFEPHAQYSFIAWPSVFCISCPLSLLYVSMAHVLFLVVFSSWPSMACLTFNCPGQTELCHGPYPLWKVAC